MIGGWEAEMTAGASSRRKGGALWQKKLMCRYVAEGEKKKGTQKRKLSPIPRKLLLYMP